MPFSSAVCLDIEETVAGIVNDEVGRPAGDSDTSAVFSSSDIIQKFVFKDIDIIIVALAFIVQQSVIKRMINCSNVGLQTLQVFVLMELNFCVNHLTALMQRICVEDLLLTLTEYHSASSSQT